MTDTERAKELLAAGGHTLVLVRGEEVITSGERGVAPLMRLAAEGKRLDGFFAADKIVGRAAALLYACFGVREVYAEVLSEGARRILEAHGIACSWGVMTANILNWRGDDLCPMEKAVSGAERPEEAVPLLRAAIERMKKQ